MPHVWSKTIVKSTFRVVGLVAGWAVLAVAARAQSVEWSQPAPSYSLYHSAVFDASRNVTVLAVRNEASNAKELWEWNGNEWRRQDNSPAVGGDPLAYDSDRGVVVAYVYSVSTGASTWERSASGWTRRAVNGPIPVSFGHSMVYDSNRNVVVCFGGARNISEGFTPSSNETWEWDGAVWTRRLVSGPSARAYHKMVYDTARGVTVLYGGQNTQTGVVNNETWEWNGQTWTQRAAGGPNSLFTLMAYDSDRGVTVRIGYDGGTGTETWEWNGTTWTPRGFGLPIRAGSGTLVYDSAREVMVCNLSNTAGALETWELSGSTWTLRMRIPPTLQTRVHMVYDSARHVAVLVGYQYSGSSTAPDCQTWERNGTLWLQRQTTTAPSARTSHAMAYDSARQVTVLFGGVLAGSGSTLVGDTWEWDGELWTQRFVPGPSPRVGHTMAYDSTRGVIVLFGGYNSTTGASQETWEWDGTTWSLRSNSGPPPQSEHSMAFDSHRHVTVLCGQNGVHTNTAPLGTWEWNGTTWTLRATTGPLGTSVHNMAFDPARNVTVLFGGRIPYHPQTHPADTWEWNGDVWTRRAMSGPIGRTGHAMAYDASRNAIVLFGGYSPFGGIRGETWELRDPTSPPCPADLDNDGDFGNGLTRDSAVTIEDLLSFLVGFEAGNVLVDLDNGTSTGTPDNAVDINDLLFFLARFEAGC